MKTVSVQALSPAAFRPFGAYARLIDPDAERFGEPPVEFFRDLLQLEAGAAGALSFSTCRVEPRERVIDISEYHSHAAEGMLPLDGDMLVHVAPATPPGEGVPVARIAVFRVPLGTLVALRPGVWHHAPFTLTDRPLNVLIALPERTYANDCVVVKLDKAEHVRIEGP